MPKSRAHTKKTYRLVATIACRRLHVDPYFNGLQNSFAKVLPWYSHHGGGGLFFQTVHYLAFLLQLVCLLDYQVQFISKFW